MTQANTSGDPRACFATTMLTGALVQFGGVLEEPSLVPEQNYRFHASNSIMKQAEWEQQLTTTYGVHDWEERALLEERLRLLHKVATDLIDKSEDIDPQIVKFVDEEFWNLV